ncbi:MAG: hypothetical protein A2Y78_12480 [Acidobacteria bacterium RBG_13_68_16]|jgi:fatty acid desaturase|nr:MAG: hypothetical protein A2Y78_12480 [Acidobacteria bacterium RBG_13_68_16]
MKIAAAICNIVWFLFTCLVLVTDGPPQGAFYIVVTLLVLLTPLLTLVVIFRSGAGDGWLGLYMKRKAVEEQRKIDDLSSMGTIMKIVAIICNLALLGFVFWALVSQPPHPAEEGYIPFVLVSVVTPIVSVVGILRGGTSGRLAASHG